MIHLQVNMRDEFQTDIRTAILIQFHITTNSRVKECEWRNFFEAMWETGESN